jgi:hypothetical protein
VRRVWVQATDRDRLSAANRADLDALIARAANKRTARAWLYREHLRDILGPQADQRTDEGGPALGFDPTPELSCRSRARVAQLLAAFGEGTGGIYRGGAHRIR